MMNAMYSQHFVLRSNFIYNGQNGCMGSTAPVSGDGGFLWDLPGLFRVFFGDEILPSYVGSIS